MRILWFLSWSLLIFLLTFLTGLYLILIAELLVIDLFITRKINWRFWTKKRLSISLPVQLILWVILTTAILRTLVFESVTIMAPSMRPQLHRGDNILISKLNFGVRLPITPINMPLTHHYLPFSRCTPSYISSIQLPYHRTRGIRTIRQGDLIAYNFPEGDSSMCGVETMSYYALNRKKKSELDTLNRLSLLYRPVDRREIEISRCIGLPGDTIRIREGRATVNGQPYHSPFPLSYDYLVEVDNVQLPQDFLEVLDLEQSEIRIFPGLGYSMPLHEEQLPYLRNRPEVKQYSLYLLDEDQPDYNIFPHSVMFPWNRDYFGAVIVPSRGDSVRLTHRNLPVYRRIIEVYEKNTLEVKNNTIFVNGNQASHYKFRMNYYFIAGDNRHHSRDSRHWGFLPEDHIIGQPLMIWFSARSAPGEKTRIHWDRIFTKLK